MLPGDAKSKPQREREAHENQLKRSAYDRFFKHCRYQYRKNRSAVLQTVLKPAHHGAVLELGSRVWYSWLGANGILPNQLICINISEKELSAGKKRAKKSLLSPEFYVMDAHKLKFPDNSFDAVIGGNILHHLDLETALKEISRVLKPGGICVFHEPLDMNPVGRIVRKLTPSARTKDEKPFRKKEINILTSYFSGTFYFEQFFSVPLGILSRLLFRSEDNLLTRFAYRLDTALIRAVPPLGYYYRQMLFTGTDRTSTDEQKS